MISNLHVSSETTRFFARAKYIPQPDGSVRLVMVQSFSRRVFRSDGWEDYRDELSSSDCLDSENSETETDEAANVERASRRAKINAFDIIQCNHDLDTFVTFTYDPKAVADKNSYDECYGALSVWLSNRVQRKGLKYVVVPERHRSGAIHFHAIMNSCALNLERAFSPKSGRPLSHKGNPLFNISDWKHGFTSAEKIACAQEDRDKVAKYIFKYMGKQCGQKIGGRYALIGGRCLQRPVYLYGDTAEEFLNGCTVKHDKVVNIGSVEYKEYSLV